MHQLIGLALVVALMLAVMPAAGGLAPDDASSLYPAAVAVPNFVSYRDRTRLAGATNPSAGEQPSRPANTAESADADDPTGFLAPHAVGSTYDTNGDESELK